MPRVYTIKRVDKPTSQRECWGVFTSHRGSDDLSHELRLFGPANRYDCELFRSHEIQTDRIAARRTDLA